MHRAHLNIGSNLGNSSSILERAVAGVALLSLSPPRQSCVVESEPWGYLSEHKYLNIGVEIEVTCDALTLLRNLQMVEHSISTHPHRNPDGSYRDRLVDIDLIYFDDMVIDAPELTLPHPRMHLRPFVLQPLEELSPQWIHPILGLTPSQLLHSFCH